MSARRTIWQASWRTLVGTILLAWISHVIFMAEAQRIALAQGLDWTKLSRWDQWTMAWRYGPPELGASIALVDPVLFVLSVVVMGVTILLGVVRWRMALRVQGLDLGAGRATEISFVAHFFNSFLLGSTGGDLMKAYYAARETRHLKPEAVVTVIVDRLMGLWAMLLFAGLMMLGNLPLLIREDRFRTLSLFILTMLIGCSVMLSLGFWGGIRRGWAGARAWLRRLPKGAWLERLLDSCRQFGKAPGYVFGALGISMVLNAVCVLQIVLLGWGLHLQLSSMVLLLVVPMIICLAAIPITPSGLGMRENLFVFMLAAPSIHVEATSALSLSLLAYAGSLIWSLVGGVVYLTLKQSHHLREDELA